MEGATGPRGPSAKKLVHNDTSSRRKRDISDNPNDSGKVPCPEDMFHDPCKVCILGRPGPRGPPGPPGPLGSSGPRGRHGPQDHQAILEKLELQEQLAPPVRLGT